jgi:pimeloyl-ACP methyl ester carboxylesterase
VLIITGQYDPATPPSDARSAASRLKRARLVIVPHSGHTAGGLTDAACIPRLVAAFLETADPDVVNTGCLAGMHRPPLALSKD